MASVTHCNELSLSLWLYSLARTWAEKAMLAYAAFPLSTSVVDAEFLYVCVR